LPENVLRGENDIVGENAMYSGEPIKIGTCEDMYYLRFDQRRLVDHIPGNVNVNSDEVYEVRFRFPFPDEDRIQPGEFERYDRSIALHGFPMPAGVKHGSVQFRADAGYLCSIPCPESGEQIDGLRIAKNGFSGAVHLVRQKLLRDGRLVPVLKCGGCGALWREEDPDNIRAMADWLIAEGDCKHNDRFVVRDGVRIPCGNEFWRKMAERLLTGANLPQLETADA
jgi:hypothetical protein